MTPDRATFESLGQRRSLSVDGVVVGAIRWDAWQDDAAVNAEVERTLGPSKWHCRVPFFGRVVGENQVSVRGNSQDIMDREIAYAADAGLDYWAFVSYADANGMSNGLKLYLASRHKKRIKFCLLGGGGLMSPRHRQEMPFRVVGCFGDENYQKVLDGRPLVYIFMADKAVGEGRTFATWADARKGLDELRAESVTRGTGNPYIVIQGWSAKKDKQTMEAVGADAIGAYAVAGARAREEGLPFSALREEAIKRWNSQKDVGAQVVPIVSAGWDRRPRAEAGGVFWEDGPGSTKHYAAPLPAELADHVREAIEWVVANPDAAPAKATLIYAWNENDEGGWLTPTLTSDGSIDSSRLDTLRGLLTK